MILDVGLPDISGIEVVRRNRRSGSAVPILFLTARDTVADRVAGLDSGADDYLVKPFAFGELTARLRSITRRRPPPAARLTCEPIALDDVGRSVCVDGRAIGLRTRESALLETLLRHPGQVLTRDQLLDHAWPFAVAVTPNSVDAYVAFLRRKLGPAADRIETVRGIGFRLQSEATDALTAPRPPPGPGPRRRHAARPPRALAADRLERGLDPGCARGARGGALRGRGPRPSLPPPRACSVTGPGSLRARPR